LVQIGESLGLYELLNESGPMSAKSMAHRTGLSERYLLEWLSAQAASGYICYDQSKESFSLSSEQAYVLADKSSPFYLTPAFGAAAAFQRNFEKVLECFKTGEGVPWGDQSECLSCAVSKFFQPSYKNHLVSSWLPSVKGMLEKLEEGASVADVGCGLGVSTMIMAEAFPKSQFTGFDFHEKSIKEARLHAESHQLGNLDFQINMARELAGQFDLVTLFDCLHDMGDPVGAMRHIRHLLKPGGSCMIVEPMAGDSLAENLNPVSRLYYSASTMVCVPTSLAQERGVALGAQAGEVRLRKVLEDAGFSSCERVSETPFNMVLEAKV
jgi:SAM-dependent methyltransferase